MTQTVTTVPIIDGGGQNQAIRSDKITGSGTNLDGSIAFHSVPEVAGAPVSSTNPLYVALTSGSVTIGTIDIDQTTPGTTNGVVVNASALPTGAMQQTGGTVGIVAGSAIVGKFGIDQTTPGTTNAVQVTAGTALIGGTQLVDSGGTNKASVSASGALLITPTIAAQSQYTVQRTVLPITASHAYSSGQVMGGVVHLSNIFQGNNGSLAVLQILTLYSDGTPPTGFAYYVFNSAPAATYTDATGLPSNMFTTDASKIVRIFNQAYGAGQGQIEGSSTTTGIQCPGGTDAWIVIVFQGTTWTPANATDMILLSIGQG